MDDPVRALGIPPGADDYAPPPPRRAARPPAPATAAALTALGALAVGFLITAGIAAGRDQALLQDERKQQLIGVIRERQDHVDGLGARLEDLRARVAAVEDEASAGSVALRRSVARVEDAAGLRGLRGPGLRVRFDDARGPCPTAQPQDCRIQDSDLQLAVNSLFAAGAEAVAVNGQRVIATTAIRNAGGAVLVNYRVLAAPYEVEAVGDPERMLARFGSARIVRDFAVWTEAYGLGFAVEVADELDVPAYDGGRTLRHARVSGEGRGPEVDR